MLWRVLGARRLSQQASVDQGERIAKYIARCGFASRREAEKLIEEGHVEIDGRYEINLGDRVYKDTVVLLDGKIVRPLRRARLFLYNKPPTEIVSTASPKKQLKTVFDSITKNKGNNNLCLPRLIAVGRLDVTTQGLLILTSSPALANHLESPSNGFDRVYLARVFGEIQEERLRALTLGVSVKGVKYKPMSIEVRRERRRNSWVEVTLSEGKNREVRSALEWAGFTVSRLIRTKFGPFELADIPMGVLREISIPTHLQKFK